MREGGGRKGSTREGGRKKGGERNDQQLHVQMNSYSTHTSMYNELEVED